MEDLEPTDGILAIPRSKDAIQYNIANLYKYCDKKGIEPKDLSYEEKKMFIIE